MPYTEHILLIIIDFRQKISRKLRMYNKLENNSKLDINKNKS